MAKYTTEDREALAIAGKRIGLFKDDSNVTPIRRKPSKVMKKQGKRAARIERLKTDEERRQYFMDKYKFEPLKANGDLPPYDVTNPTRYPEAKLPCAEEALLRNIFQGYRFILGAQSITPDELRKWRENFLQMTPEQLGTLIRVDRTTVMRWESGQTKIPFSMWWVMHSTLQDPQYFLTRPGFHDFYITYEDGMPLLCSWEYPEIRFSPGDLYLRRVFLNEVFKLQNQLQAESEKVTSLERENTELRLMFKSGAVTQELQAMRGQIEHLLTRIQTADVLPFQLDTVHGQNSQAESLADKPVKFA